MSGILWIIYLSGVVEKLTIAFGFLIGLYFSVLFLSSMWGAFECGKYDEHWNFLKRVCKFWCVPVIATVFLVALPSKTMLLSYAGFSVAEKVVENKTASQLVDKTVLLINKKLDDALAGDNDKGSK